MRPVRSLRMLLVPLRTEPLSLSLSERPLLLLRDLSPRDLLLLRDLSPRDLLRVQRDERPEREDRSLDELRPRRWDRVESPRIGSAIV